MFTVLGRDGLFTIAKKGEKSSREEFEQTRALIVIFVALFFCNKEKNKNVLFCYISYTFLCSFFSPTRNLLVLCRRQFHHYHWRQLRSHMAETVSPLPLLISFWMRFHLNEEKKKLKIIALYDCLLCNSNWKRKNNFSTMWTKRNFIIHELSQKWRTANSNSSYSFSVTIWESVHFLDSMHLYVGRLLVWSMINCASQVAERTRVQSDYHYAICITSLENICRLIYKYVIIHAFNLIL